MARRPSRLPRLPGDTVTPRPLTGADRATIAAYIARVWPAICREAGWLRSPIPPAPRLGVVAQEGVEHTWIVSDCLSTIDIVAAVASLADEIEATFCLELAREPGRPPRVLGWATAEQVGRWPDGEPSHFTARIVDLEPSHSARAAWQDRKLAERLVRTPMPDRNAKDHRR